MVKWNTPAGAPTGRSGVRLVKGQFEFDPVPLGERIASRIRDPLSRVTTQDRAEYQTRYNQSVREKEIALIDKMIEHGAQFDEADIKAMQDSRPGEILEKVASRARQGDGGRTPEQRHNDIANPGWDRGVSEKNTIQSSNEGLRQDIEALGGEAPEEHKGPSGLLRALDIVSRPAYMTAAMFDKSKDAQAEGEGLWGQVTAGLHGAASGLAGTEKTTWHENLKEHGAPFVNKPMHEGKATGALGFALDVALDPTTYMTLGTGTAVKQGLKEAAEVGAKEVLEAGSREAAELAVKEAVEEGGEKAFGRKILQAADSEKVLGGKGSRAVRNAIVKTAREDAENFAKAAGQKLSAEELDKVGKKALREAEDQATKRVADASVEAKRLAETLGKTKQVELKFMGKKIASSEKLYRPIRVVADNARATKVGETLNKAFRTDAVVGGEVRRLERIFSNASAARYETELKEIQQAFMGSSKAERKAVAQAIEAGTTQAIAGSPKLLAMHDTAKEWFERIAANEVEAGALKADDLADNYVYHVYRNKAKRRLGGPVPKGGKYKTIAEAKQAGANPLEDISDMLAHRLAKSHKITSRYDLHTEIAKRFGIDIGTSSTRDKALRRLVQDGYLTSGKKVSSIMPAEKYFDSEIGEALKTLDEFFTRDEVTNKFLKNFDRIQAKFKFAMTAPNMGFQIRNMLGDAFTNMLDGVVDPRMYDFGFNMMRSTLEPGNPMYRDFRGTIRIGKKSVSAEEIRIAYEGQGLKSGFFHADTGFIPSPGRRVLSKASSGIRTASEFREDWMRMTHFVDAMRKEASTKAGAKQSLNTLAEKAAARVKKFNFDYQDLTHFERAGLRRAIPFYTFMRKNIPLQLEMLFTRPGRVAVLPKGLKAMQEIVGEPQGEDPFPGLPDVVPDWIRDFPTFQTQTATASQPSIFMQPDFPINQLQDYLGGFVDDSGSFDLTGGLRQAGTEAMGATTPVASIPAEWAMQRDLQTGAPVDQSFVSTVLNQIPAYGTYGAAVNPTEQQAEQQVGIGGHNISERLLNYLTGASVRVNTPQRQKSQLKRDEDILRAILERLKEEQGLTGG